MRTILINKTELAVLRMEGNTPTDIAKHYGITLAETVETLKAFGYYKTKKTTEKTKDYAIELVDDTNKTTKGTVVVEYATLEN